MSRPLDGVQAKLERAQHHLKALHAAVGIVFREDPVIPDTKLDPDTGDHIVWVKYIPDLPPVLGAILGDFLHDLRSGLNHLAFELVRVVGALTPAVEENVQFPIYDKPPKAGVIFQQRVAKVLPGVGPDPLAIIERHQPYNRPDLGRLGTLSNQDKHRIPVLMLSRTMSVMPKFRAEHCSVEVIPIAIMEPMEVGAEVVRLRLSDCKKPITHVQMQGHFIPEVTFEDGVEIFTPLMGLGGQCRIIAEELEFFVEPPAYGTLPWQHRRRWPSFATLP